MNGSHLGLSDSRISSAPIGSANRSISKRPSISFKALLDQKNSSDSTNDSGNEVSISEEAPASQPKNADLKNIGSAPSFYGRLKNTEAEIARNNFVNGVR